MSQILENMEPISNEPIILWFEEKTADLDWKKLKFRIYKYQYKGFTSEVQLHDIPDEWFHPDAEKFIEEKVLSWVKNGIKENEERLKRFEKAQLQRLELQEAFKKATENGKKRISRKSFLEAYQKRLWKTHS